MNNKAFLENVVYKDEELKKFVNLHHWVSGSSTIVYPYALWDGSIPHIEIQLKSEFVYRKGRYNYQFYVKPLKQLQAIAKRLTTQYNNVSDVSFITNDGSCPPEMRIYLTTPKTT